jgi:addiction module HigA family antidote
VWKQKQPVSRRLLAYDTTNFYTYVASTNTRNELARALRVPMNRISAIVNGRRAITVDTAMSLARYFGTSPRYWLNLQIAYDIEVAG